MHSAPAAGFLSCSPLPLGGFQLPKVKNSLLRPCLLSLVPCAFCLCGYRRQGAPGTGDRATEGGCGAWEAEIHSGPAACFPTSQLGKKAGWGSGGPRGSPPPQSSQNPSRYFPPADWWKSKLRALSGFWLPELHNPLRWPCLLSLVPCAFCTHRDRRHRASGKRDRDREGSF